MLGIELLVIIQAEWRLILQMGLKVGVAVDASAFPAQSLSNSLQSFLLRIDQSHILLCLARYLLQILNEGRVVFVAGMRFDK
jgi:hypothetical protein